MSEPTPDADGHPLFSTMGQIYECHWREQLIYAMLTDGTDVRFKKGAFVLYDVKRDRKGNEIETENILAQMPLVIKKPVCRFRDIVSAAPVPALDSFRFRIEYDGTEMEAQTVEEIVQTILAGGKGGSKGRTLIYAFFTVLKSYILNQGDFEERHDDIETDGMRIAVWRGVEDPKAVLSDLNRLSRIVTHPNAFAGLLSYMCVYPFSYELRQEGVLTPLPLLDGRSQTGKSRMAELIVCKGFDQPEAFKTMESVKTAHALNWTMNDGRYPFVIDDIDMAFIRKFEGFMRSTVSGTGESQRGNLTAKGISVKHAKRLPVLTTNRIDELQEEMTNRFIQWRFSSEQSNRVDRNVYFQIVESLPQGFMFVFIKKWYNGNTIQGMVDALKDGHDTTGLKERYLAYGYNIVKHTFQYYGVPCEIPEPKLQEENTLEWNDIFKGWLEQFRTAYDKSFLEGQKSNAWLDRLINDIELTTDGWRITVKAWKEFCKEFRDCPYSCRSFGERYGYAYQGVRIRGGPAVKGLSLEKYQTQTQL